MINNYRGILVLIVLSILLVGVLIWIFHNIRLIKLDKRLSKYTISSSEEVSLLDKLRFFYLGVRDKVSIFLTKVGLSDYQYRGSTCFEDEFSSIDLLSTKLIFAVIGFIISIITSLYIDGVNSFLYCMVITVIFFFIPNLKLRVNYYIVRKSMQEDLLKALTLINHSFQSGNSILQAIKTVSDELDTPLGNEFNRIYKDISYGLSLTTAFKRFSDRIKLDEVNYITTSLIILNETGGDIVSVFQSIEDNFYTRRSLNQELRAITASSRALFFILTSVPIILFIMIVTFSPDYFGVLFSTPIGILIFGFIILLYLVYIIIVRRIMRVEKY